MKAFLIIKAGSRFKDPSLMSDFDDWMIRGLAVDPSNVWVVAVYEGEPLPDHSDVAGVVVTGSHAMVTDREDWSERTAAWLRDGVQKETPILAVCYGHQLLAHGLGGTVGDHPLGQELGTVEVVVNATGQKDRLIGQLPERFSAQASHRQSVLELPDGARLLAGNDHEAHHVFAVGNWAWGVQFHPEMDATAIRVSIERHAYELVGRDVGAIRAAVRETPEAHSVLKRFADLVRNRVL